MPRSPTPLSATLAQDCVQSFMPVFSPHLLNWTCDVYRVSEHRNEGELCSLSMILMIFVCYTVGWVVGRWRDLAQLLTDLF